MIMEMHDVSKSLQERGIDFTYVGPMWGNGIKGIAEMVKNHLNLDAELPLPASMAVLPVT